MNVSYLFSRNKKIGSRAIAWASGLLIKDLEKTPSHMAILIEFDNLLESIVLESTLDSGVRIVPYTNWLKINELCYKIPSNKKHDLNDILQTVVDYWGKKYDWGGIAYFAFRFLLHFFFKTPFPKENAWQCNSKFFCNELCGEIAEYQGYSMATPAKMCSDFLKQNIY